MRNGTSLTAALGALALLAACAPIQETRYNFLPPKDGPGQACVAQCSASHSACLREADTLAIGERDRCELEARQDYELCLTRPVTDSQQRCALRRCEISAEAAACDEPYRSCFRGCGGTVEGRQVCISNCE